MQHLTLSEFSKQLTTGEGDFKETLVLDSGSVLQLNDSADVARLLATLTVLAFPPSKTEILTAIAARAEGYPVGTKEWSDVFLAHEYELPFDRYQRTKSGALKPNPVTRLPDLQADNSKKGALLENPYDALKKLNLHTICDGKALQDILTSRSTHPAKLSYAQASGSFVLVAPRKAYPASVTEADFQTVQNEAFASNNAAVQAAANLFIARVFYAGRLYRAYQLLGQDGMAAEVQAHWTSNDVDDATYFLQLLQTYRAVPHQGEPQVFVGPVPCHACLSILTPYSLFKEAARAKEALHAAHELSKSNSGLEGAIADIENQLAEANLELANKTPKPTAERKGELKKLVDSLKKEKTSQSEKLKVLKKSYLDFKPFQLMFGGAKPNNLVNGVDTSLHAANVRLFVPVSRQHRVDKSGARAFVSDSLLSRHIELPHTLPRSLVVKEPNARERKEQARFFECCVLNCLSPLLELQYDWRQRHDELLGVAALSQEAAQLTQVPPEFKLFITGAADFSTTDESERLSATERRELISRLARAVAARVSEALLSKYSVFSAVHDELLRATALSVVTKEA